MKPGVQGVVFRGLALGLIGAAVAVAARGLERHNTWYLASDQFAFLTFARDLRAGRVFHDLGLYAQLGAPARPGRTFDALFQTYFLRDGRLYSRYPPGFPALLAAAGAAFGEQGEHWLNPALYLGLLVLVAWVTASGLRRFDRRMAAGAAVSAAWLTILLPTEVHLWGITVVRDLPTHLLALLSILAAIRRRPLACGAALGLACTIRPDALLYGVSIAGVFLVQRVPMRAKLLAAAAFLVAALPLFAYNTATLGHPLAFTQGGEFQGALGAAPRAPTAVYAQALPLPSGGGFRLRNLATSLPGNLRSLEASFGWLGALAALGAAWSARVRPVVAVAFAPYAIVGLLFYSCWSHPDPRYLAGVSLAAIVLTATGVAAAARWIAGAGARPGRLAAALAACGALAALGWRAATTGESFSPGAPEVALALAAAVIALVAAVRAPRAPERFSALAPGLALAALAVARLLVAAGGRDPFQREQVERARAAVEALVPAGGVVVTSEALGRPAENITHYTHADARYASELPLLGRDAASLVGEMALVGRPVFFLLPADDEETLRATRSMASAAVVARRSGRDLYDWFVDPRRAPRGAVLYAVELKPEMLGPLREYDRVRRQAAPSSR